MHFLPLEIPLISLELPTCYIGAKRRRMSFAQGSFFSRVFSFLLQLTINWRFPANAEFCLIHSCGSLNLVLILTIPCISTVTTAITAIYITAAGLWLKAVVGIMLFSSNFFFSY